MKALEEITTLVKTITWMAEERMKKEKYQDINSATHAIVLETSTELLRIYNER